MFFSHGSLVPERTLLMSDDIENQKAARLAKLAEPQGLRTIGVLTKPDMLTAGATKSRDLWLQVLEGRRHQLRHGYYCTRQPDDDERSRGIAAAAALTAETAFFQTTAPWASSNQRDRFGAPGLVRSISKLLTQIIQESLPPLLEQVTEQVVGCNEQLSKLPPAITTEPAALGFVVAPLTEFSNELSQSSAPPFVPYKDDADAPRDVSEYARADPRDRRYGRNNKFGGKVLYLEDVREHITASITRELPGNVPYAAKLSLFRREFQNSWEGSALGCFERVQEVFQTALSALIQKCFERYGNLMTTVRPVASELLHLCVERTIGHIRTALELETSPSTQNHHYFSEYRDTEWLAKYKDARAGKTPPNVTNPVPPSTSTRPSVSTPLSPSGQLPVASKRVIDYIPLTIDHQFLYAFVKDLQRQLFEHLGLGTPHAATRCTTYIAEDATVVSTRDELMSKKKRLEAVQRELFNFGLC